MEFCQTGGLIAKVAENQRKLQKNYQVWSLKNRVLATIRSKTAHWVGIFKKRFLTLLGRFFEG